MLKIKEVIIYVQTLKTVRGGKICRRSKHCSVNCKGHEKVHGENSYSSTDQKTRYQVHLESTVTQWESKANDDTEVRACVTPWHDSYPIHQDGTYRTSVFKGLTE